MTCSLARWPSATRPLTRNRHRSNPRSERCPSTDTTTFERAPCQIPRSVAPQKIAVPCADWSPSPTSIYIATASDYVLPRPREATANVKPPRICSGSSVAAVFRCMPDPPEASEECQRRASDTTGNASCRAGRSRLTDAMRSQSHQQTRASSRCASLRGDRAPAHRICRRRPRSARG